MKLVSPITLRKRGVLGMNSRNINYVGRCNPRELYPLVDNKLKTKQAAMEHGMAVPKLFGVLSIQRDVKRLAEILGDLGEFVIKPAQGSGGKGILVIEGRSGDSFTKSSGATLDLGELEYHASNILSGVYSLGGRPDTAMIEALINFDEQLARYSYEGVPDIRVIVYRGIPVMAMLRCATHASDGKANLHQGAVGVGLDMGTGFSLYAVQNGERIASHPDTGQAFDALYIPHWRKVLELAAGCTYTLTEVGRGRFTAISMLAVRRAAAGPSATRSGSPGSIWPPSRARHTACRTSSGGGALRSGRAGMIPATQARSAARSSACHGAEMNTLVGPPTSPYSAGRS